MADYRLKEYPIVGNKPVPREIVEHPPRSRYDIALDKYPMRTRPAATLEEIDAWVLLNPEQCGDAEYIEARLRERERQYASESYAEAYKQAMRMQKEAYENLY